LHALDHAVALATRYQSKLTVLHVHAPMLLAVPMPLAADRGGGDDDGASEIARTTESVRALALPAIRAGVPVAVKVDMGQAAPGILASASDRHADMIVMGTHGTSGFQHLMLGSITEKVLRRASCPVLTVPPRACATSALPFGRILCPLDFSEPSLAALSWAWSLARESGTVVSLLHVIEWPWEEPPAPHFEELPPMESQKLTEFRRALETRSWQKLRSLVPPDISDRGLSSMIVRHGKPHRELLAAAAESRADLIVMGVHGRNVVDLTLFGSTTNQVVRGATCPVLTVRQAARS
jgi:nucleotide-binding universal stress UspA family protein